MKRKAFFNARKNDRVIALFGTSRLVRTGEGRFELRGGSEDDRSGAMEWISLFMHDVVPRVVACSQ